ncbi:MAG: phosphotransferase [Chloroflexota bacterium]
MLLSADIDLVRRDPIITGLETLLDADAFATALDTALPTVSVRAAQATYVRYKPGTNCLVAYKVKTDRGSVPVYARAYSAELGVKLGHVRRVYDQPSVLDVGGLCLDKLDTSVYVWPYDYKLRNLAHLSNPEQRTVVIDQLTSHVPELSGSILTDLRYRPERRYVGRLDGATRSGLFKLYRKEDYEHVRSAATAFYSTELLNIVPLLGESSCYHALLFHWQAGCPLNDSLWNTTWEPAVFRDTGKALALLHGQDAATLPTLIDQNPRDALAAAVQSIVVLCPNLERQVQDLAKHITTSLAQSPEIRPIHGDFYADQVLLNGNQITILDLDNATWGEPAFDLATFAAHLWRMVVQGNGTAARAVQIIEALFAGYDQQGVLPSRTQIALHTAAGLLRLAPEPFRYRRENWLQRVHALVLAAEEILTHEHIRT